MGRGKCIFDKTNFIIIIPENRFKKRNIKKKIIKGSKIYKKKIEFPWILFGVIIRY